MDKQGIDSSQPKVSGWRVRTGLILWVVSFVPFPVVLADALHHNGVLTSDQATRNFTLVLWAIQYAIGLVGLAVAGKEAIVIVRARGWRQLPRSLWQTLLGRPVT